MKGRTARPWADRLPPPIVMMGVPFDQVTTAQVLQIIDEMISSRKPHLLATANVDFLAQVQKDEGLQRVLVEADLVVCDGTPLVWMSKFLGDPLPERVAGSDLVPLLLDVATARNYRVFFLGGRDEVLAEAEKKILLRWPTLTIAGVYSPPFAPLDKMDHADIRRRVQEARADILFVAFGCPKQEKWLAMNYKETGVPVAIGVGATIDFLAGSVKRAPVWMRKSGLEWLYRVLQEPKRLAGRYWRDIRVVSPGLIRQFLKMRGKSVKAPEAVPDKTPAPAVSKEAVPCLLKLPARLDAISARDASLWAEVEANPSPWIIADASQTTFLDSTGTGRLVRLARMAKERGGRIVLAGATAAVTGPLALMKLRQYFNEAASVSEAMASLPSAV